MERTVNPNSSTDNNNVTGERLTTNMLGIADAKAKDLAGYILSTKELVDATTKILMTVGVDFDDIYDIRVGVDTRTQKLRIICEVRYKAAYPKNKSSKSQALYNLFNDYSDDEDNSKTAFNAAFYNALHNKTYHAKKKHLKMRTITREIHNERKKFVQFEFDPEILIAFVYNIAFSDPMYKVSTRPIRWKSRKELDRDDNLTKKEERKYISRQNRYKEDHICECEIYVTFNDNWEWHFTRRDQDGNVIHKRGTGFHPGDVDYYCKHRDQ